MPKLFPGFEDRSPFQSAALRYVCYMTDSQGFWSYVRDDDTADGGRIVQLARDIAGQYQMLTNERIALFIDRDDLSWGDEWQKQIEGSLATVAFFIPVLTPRYFASAACRGEFNAFARRASDLGIEQLLLPLLYVDFPSLNDDDPQDDMVRAVKQFQWVDWRELRFSDANSPEYRRAVSALAARLVEANRTAELTARSDEAIARAESIDDDLGAIELLAAFETALPDLSSTTNSLNSAVVEIGSLAEAAGNEINSQVPGSQTFARRLLIIRTFASDMAGPSDRISALGDDFARQLHDVDIGVRLIIEKAPDEPESRDQFCEFFAAIRGMVEAADKGLGALDGLLRSLEPIEKLSRDVRPPFRKLRRGLTLVMEGRNVMSEWVSLIDESEFEC